MQLLENAVLDFAALQRFLNTIDPKFREKIHPELKDNTTLAC